MINFEFQNTTKIYFGDNYYLKVADELKKYGNKVLLAYGGGSIKRIGLYDKVINIIKEAGLEVVELAGVEPNPRHTTVNRGALLCKENNIDVILAVGGGSTIDCAKAIAAATYYDGDAWDLVIGKAKVIKALPIVTVLTLSATGSEMDNGGVISNMDTNEKIGLHNDLLLPKASFLDPSNTVSVNKYQTAAGSADILSHMFDCTYFTFHPQLEMTKKITESVIKTVIKYSKIAVNEPENIEARENLMWASSWALNGFLFSGVKQRATCHAIEHELSAFYDITHGHGLAIITPRWLSYILNEKTAPIIYEFGQNIFDINRNLDTLVGAKLSIEALSRYLFDDLKLASKLTDLGIDDKNFEKMAIKACKNDIIHGFVDLNVQDVINIFKMCL